MDATPNASDTGQVNRSAADVYAEFFVPALFAEWAPRVAAAAEVCGGDRVLDVACGTGVLARDCAGRGGAITGLDRNAGMLAVARRTAGIDWREGMAEDLPFADGTFDTVVSQFGLMFFDDRAMALAEMWRVLTPGGRLAVAVWGSLEETPGYTAMTNLLAKLFGEETADAIRAPYCLGDREALAALFEGAGIPDARIETQDGTARFPSIADWIHTDIKGWTLADAIDDTQYATLRDAAETELREFVRPDGTVRFRHPAHIVTAAKG